jgi:hypothetical protein
MFEQVLQVKTYVSKGIRFESALETWPSRLTVIFLWVHPEAVTHKQVNAASVKILS